MWRQAKWTRLWSSKFIGIRFNGVKNLSDHAFAKRCDTDAEVVVIGGGAVGTSIAYHLAKLGKKDIILLEKTELTAGSTWHAAGLTALYHSGINMKKLHYYSINLFAQLADEVKQELNYHIPGSVRLATNATRMDEFRYQMQRQGWQKAPQKLVTPEEIQKLCPLLNMDKILGGIFSPNDGHIDPYSLTMALAKGARKYGAEIYQGVTVERMSMGEDGLWEVGTSEGVVRARHVVNAAGFWAHEVGQIVGLELPLVPAHHQYIITTTIPEVQQLEKEFPVFRHLEGSFYLRKERDGLLIGPYEHQKKMQLCDEWITKGVPPGFGKELFQPDLDRISEHLDIAMDLVPVLKTANIQTVVSGPIMYTPDVLPLIGPSVHLPNYWLAVGFSYGIVHSAGAGRYLADWIINGEPPYDLLETDPSRFGKWATREYVCEKVKESYGMNNSYTFPKEERWEGRPTERVSQIYEELRKRGAEMGFHAGWEQPAWFSLEGDTAGYQPSFRRSNWFEPVGRECKLVMEKAGIIDLTPFAKFDFKGSGAANFLDKLVANSLPKVGTTNICHMLSSTGKVYAELTVTALNPQRYFVVTGSGSELHDLRWLTDHARLWNSQVTISNVTDDIACLAIAGPLSRDVLRKLTSIDLSDDAFPFLSAQEIILAGIPVRAIRISYTGELGWELYHDSGITSHLYEALVEVGVDKEIGNFGTYALNSLRLEKGFKLWGAEMNMDHDPYEAGLQMFLKPNKETNFIGKEALRKIRREGLLSKLAYLEVDADDVDPEGNESVWCSGKVVGYTTSGAYGYTVKKSLAFAYLPCFLTIPGTEVQVELLGSLRNARVLAKPPVDTESVRQRKMATV